MARFLGNNESAFESARSQFWVVDAKVRSHIQISQVIKLSIIVLQLSGFEFLFMVGLDNSHF